MNTSSRKFKSIVFFDIGITNLKEPGNKQGKPSLSSRIDTSTTGITELCLIGVSCDHFLKFDGSEPRILRKLVIPVDPEKKFLKQTTTITGLDHPMLANEGPMSASKLYLLKNFIEDMQGPVCLIAHRGLDFIFPLLKFEMKKKRVLETIFSDSVGFAGITDYLRELSSGLPDTAANVVRDSASPPDMSRSLGNLNLSPPNANANGAGGSTSTTPQAEIKHELESLYQRIHQGSEMRKPYSAETSAMALLECCVKYRKEILDWIENTDNYVQFERIQLL